MKRFSLILLFCLFTTITFAQEVVFAYLADVHIAEGAQSISDAEACIKDINSRGEAQFVIFAGDITEFGSDEEIAIAKSIFDKLDVPYYIVAGNHDSKWSESGCNTFKKVFGYEAFEFEVDGIKFIGTNSGPNMRMAPALLPRESVIWLDSLVNAVEVNKPIVFVNHYPMDNSMLNYFEVLDILKRKNIQLIMCGHGHNNAVLDFEGIPAIMGRSSLETGKEGAGYNLVTIEGSTISFQEQVVEKEIKQPWHKLRMSRGMAFDPKKEYSRPNYDINKEYPSIKPLWAIQDSTDIGAGATVAGDKVIYANTSGVVKALSVVDGKELWRYTTDGKIFSTPAVESGRVVVGSSDNNIYCLDLNSGKLLWKFACKKSVLASPAIYKGTIYIGASDNIFRAIDLVSGKLVWSYNEIKGFIESKAFVDRAQVVVGDWRNRLYSFNPKTGALQWFWTNNHGRGYSAAAVWPVKANNKIFIITPERKTYAIDAKTGEQLWVEKGGREAIGLSPDKRQVYSKTMRDTLLAFSTIGDKAKLVWASNAEYGYEIAPSPITSISKKSGDLLFIPTDKGDIIALNVADGSIAWKHKVSIALINYVLPFGDDKLLVTTMDGVVTILKY